MHLAQRHPRAAAFDVDLHRLAGLGEGAAKRAGRLAGEDLPDDALEIFFDEILSAPQIFATLLTHEGALYVATDQGLRRSADQGATFVVAEDTVPVGGEVREAVPQERVQAV